MAVSVGPLLSDRFYWFVGPFLFDRFRLAASVGPLLIGCVCLAVSIVPLLFGNFCLAVSVWPLLFGRFCVAASVWPLLFGRLCSGAFVLMPSVARCRLLHSFVDANRIVTRDRDTATPAYGLVSTLLGSRLRK